MKRNKKLFILPLFVLLLTSCDFLLFKASYIRESSESTSEQSLTTSISEESSTPPTSDGNIESSVPTTSEGSESSTPSISEPPVETRPTSGTETFSFYAINDLHGALHARPEIAEPGLAKAGALLKAKKQERPDNTVILSTGDMWQGTFEAYHSKGEVVTLAMNEIGFDLMAIGNHEFDWGPEYILDNIAVTLMNTSF
ncbi:MAG TPA: metallophosphoesterase [Bacilli bacterium]|nr:metallophosphoesterase [Bacilli bacterium]